MSNGHRLHRVLVCAGIVVSLFVMAGCPDASPQAGFQSNGESDAVYQIGDTCPAGGIVFYDKGEYSNGWRYLAVAPKSTEWEGQTWGGYGTVIGPSAQNTPIGTGAANTEAIVQELGHDDYAARLCANLVHGGCDKWFLPSKDELREIYDTLHNIAEPLDEFETEAYWSSSESDDPEKSDQAAWGKNFFNGYEGIYNKGTPPTMFTRAVRAF